MKVLLNYANDRFKLQQTQNTATGLSTGGFDHVLSYGPKDISPEFYKKNRHILRKRHGNGYWLWKFYFLNQALEQLSEGDFLFYSDSDSHFIGSIDPLIELCTHHKQDVVPFEIQYSKFECIEKHWTKRDAFKILEVDTPSYRDTAQRMGGFMLFRKSKYSQDLMHEILTLAQDERLITDLDNQLGFPNYPGFREHRHDQSIWSLVTKKNGLKAFRDLTQNGNYLISSRNDSPYGQICVLDDTERASRSRIRRYCDELSRYGFTFFIRTKFQSLINKVKL